MVFLKAQLTGRMKDSHYLIKCLIEDIENNISKAKESPEERKKRKQEEKETREAERTYAESFEEEGSKGITQEAPDKGFKTDTTGGKKAVEGFIQGQKRQQEILRAWERMKPVGESKVRTDKRGRKYTLEDSKSVSNLVYNAKKYNKDFPELNGKKEAKRQRLVLQSDSKDVKFKTSTNEIIETVGKKGLLADLKSLNQYKEFLDVTSLAAIVNDKKNITVDFKTDSKNKKLQIEEYFSNQGKKRIKEIYDRIHRLLMSAKDKAHKGTNKKAISEINKVIVDNYNAFANVVSTKKVSAGNISQIKELEVADDEIKPTTMSFFKKLEEVVTTQISNIRDDSDEKNEANNQKAIANIFKGNDPKLIFNILTNLDASKEKAPPIFGDPEDSKTTDLVSGRSGKDTTPKGRTAEQIEPDAKKIADKRRVVAPEKDKYFEDNPVKKAEEMSNKIFNIIDVENTSKGNKLVLRKEPYSKGTKGYGNYLKLVKSIMEALNQKIGKKKALDIFVKYGTKITGLKDPKSKKSPTQKETGKSFLSQKRKELANKKKLLSKEERQYLKIPTNIKNDILDISEELLAEVVNFNAFLLVNPIELDRSSFKYTKNEEDKDVLISGKYQKKKITDESSPAYWYNKIKQLVGKDKDKGLISSYYKKLNLALDYKKVQSISDKINALSDDEKELKEKIKEYSNELANFEGGMESLVELSKAFEEMKKPYIDLFIEVSDLKSQITGEIPKSMTDTQLRQLVKRKYDDYVKGNKTANIFGISVSEAFDYVSERTRGPTKTFLYQSKKDYEEDVRNKVEEAKLKYFTSLEENKDVKLDEITEKDLNKIKNETLIEEGFLSAKDVQDYPETDKGKKEVRDRQSDYFLGKKNIPFTNAVKGRLLGMVKEYMDSMEDGSKPDENKLEEEYSKKKEELSKMEEEITAMIVASPYFDKKAKGTRIAGELILNRDNKSMWHKSVVSDTRRKEYFSAKETFMGIQLEGQIKNEAVSIFEIMGGSYSMNLDAVTDYKKLNRQLKKLSKKIDSTIEVRERLNNKILDEIESGEEE